MSRQGIAYLMIVVLALALAAIVAWRVYHSRDRVLGRRRNRERAFRKAGRRSFEDG